MAGELKELYEELMKKTENNQDYMLLQDAVREIETMNETLHKKSFHGAEPVVSALHKENLMTAHRTLARASERILDTNEGTKDPVIRDLVFRIAALASQNYNALSKYDPKNDPKSMPEILAEARGTTVDLRGAKLRGKIGAALSSRQPLTFLTDSGQEVTGVFTPKKEIHIMRDLDAKFQESAKDAVTDEGAFICKNFMKRLHGKMKDIFATTKHTGLTGDPSFDFGTFMHWTTPDHKTKKVDDERVDTAIRVMFPEQVKDKSPEELIGKAVYDDLKNEMRRIYAPATVNFCGARIPDDSRIDNRNSAMSAVADLLGVPNLLARSRPMTVINDKGEKVEGTFMLEGKGITVDNLPEWAAHITPVSYVSQGDAFRSVADLQVLDYICGNTDRHAGNLMYQFDNFGYYQGSQGIDNDNCLGRLVLRNGAGQDWLPGTSEMGVVSQSMYEKVMALSPDMLKYTLRGYGLSENELRAAAERLRVLKAAMKEGVEYYRTHDPKDPDADRTKIRVIPDKDFAKLDPNSLRYNSNKGKKDAKGRGRVNLFQIVCTSMTKFASYFRKQTKAYKTLRNEAVIGAENRLRRTAPQKLEKQMDRTVQLLKKRSKSRDSYENVTQAVREYRNYLRELQAKITAAAKDSEKAKKKGKSEDPQVQYDSVLGLEQLNKMTLLAKNVKTEADKYLAKYPGDPKQYPQDVQDRIEIVTTAKMFGEKGSVQKEEEKDLARRNEKSGLDKYIRGMGEKAEAIAAKNRPKQQLIL